MPKDTGHTTRKKAISKNISRTVPKREATGILPAAMQLRKLASYFTPPGIVALYFGVPAVIVTVLFFIARKAMKKVK